MKNKIVLSKEVSEQINVKFKENFSFNAEQSNILPVLDNEIKEALFAREVSIYLSNEDRLEDNSYYLVECYFEDKLIKLTSGKISGKTIYGVIQQ